MNRSTPASSPRFASDEAPSQTIDNHDGSLLLRQPKVSVGMLAYRHGEFIAQAIESVVAQQCDFPFELVIGEDCSPDDTLEIARAYQQRYPGIIRILTGTRNVGMQANSLRCQSVMRGDLVTYCEGDDYWCDPTKLARQAQVFSRQPECSLVFHSAWELDAAGGRRRMIARWSPFPRLVRTREVILGDGGFIPTASMMVDRRRVLDTLPAWAALAAAPDYALALWATSVGKIVYINRAMSVYRSNVTASWSSRHVLQLDHRMAHAQRIEQMFESFVAEGNGQHRHDAKRMISKYYSDALVRVPASRSQTRAMFEEVRSKLSGSDHAFAWLAARGIRLAGLKSLLRMAGTVWRLLRSMPGTYPAPGAETRRPAEGARQR